MDTPLKAADIIATIDGDHTAPEDLASIAAAAFTDWLQRGTAEGHLAGAFLEAMLGELLDEERGELELAMQDHISTATLEAMEPATPAAEPSAAAAEAEAAASFLVMQADKKGVDWHTSLPDLASASEARDACLEDGALAAWIVPVIGFRMVD